MALLMLINGSVDVSCVRNLICKATGRLKFVCAHGKPFCVV